MWGVCVCVCVCVCVEREREKEGVRMIYFKKLAHVIVGTGVSKSAGQAGDSGKN